MIRNNADSRNGAFLALTVLENRICHARAFEPWAAVYNPDFGHGYEVGLNTALKYVHQLLEDYAPGDRSF
jgi:hypothetical protein